MCVLPAFGFSLAARLAARRAWMLRGAGKRGGSLTGHVAEEFLLSLKLGGGVFHPILNLKV